MYDEVIKEINYNFGDVFIFDGFIISEVKEGISFSWQDHAKSITDDVFEFTKTKGDGFIHKNSIPRARENSHPLYTQ